MLYSHTMYIFSGGTVVTVSGLHLDSVAAPLISLTVVVTVDDDSSMSSTVSTVEVIDSTLWKSLYFL